MLELRRTSGDDPTVDHLPTDSVFLKKFGADPATSSSIILTTITDIVSMGTMLILASLLVSYLI